MCVRTVFLSRSTTKIPMRLSRRPENGVATTCIQFYRKGIFHRKCDACPSPGARVPLCAFEYGGAAITRYRRLVVFAERVMSMSRTKLGKPVFQALVTLKHNNEQIRSWASADKRTDELVALLDASRGTQDGDIDWQDAAWDNASKEEIALLKRTLKCVAMP